MAALPASETAGVLNVAWPDNVLVVVVAPAAVAVTVVVAVFVAVAVPAAL